VSVEAHRLVHPTDAELYLKQSTLPRSFSVRIGGYTFFMNDESKKKTVAKVTDGTGAVKTPVPLELVQNKILMIRDRRVLLDSDLAEL
jgi:hypothetical protein